MNFSSLIRRPALLLGLIACGGMTLQAQDTTAPAATSSATAATSLVSNGDFSKATQDPTWPDDWGKSAGVTWGTEGGKHFLHLAVSAPGQMVMVYRAIPLPAGTQKLDVTIQYRTSGIVHGEQNWMDARAIFHFLDASGKQVNPDPHPIIFSKDSGGWVKATETYTVPAGATQFVLMPSLFKVDAGTLDLGEISVTNAGS